MDIARYLSALRRRWYVVALSTAIAATAGFVTAQVAAGVGEIGGGRTYQATAYLEKQHGVTSLLTTVSTLAYFSRLRPVTERVAAIVGSSPEQVAGRYVVTPHPEKSLLEITATGATPRAAREMAEAAARGLVEFLNARRRANADEAIRLLRQQIAELRASGASEQVIRPYQLQIAGKHVLAKTPVGLEFLQRPVASAVRAGPLEAPRTRVARTAAAAALGLLGGLALLLVLERFDTRVRTGGEVEGVSKLPLLAEIPVLPSRSRDGIVVASDPLSKAASAFHVLAASILSQLPPRNPETNGHGSHPSVVLITSAEPREGRTTVAANVAASLAQRGTRVLALSADLRHPALHERFDIAADPGLVDFLTTDEPLNVTRIPAIAEELRVVPSGGTSAHPVELLAGPRMREAFAVAARLADVVIVDAPAMFGTGDALPLLQHVDAVVLLARAGHVRVDVLERLLDLLRIVGAPVVGIAVNAARERLLASRPVRRDRDVVEAVR